jgi:hypothetical protein
MPLNVIGFLYIIKYVTFSTFLSSMHPELMNRAFSASHSFKIASIGLLKLKDHMSTLQYVHFSQCFDFIKCEYFRKKLEFGSLFTFFFAGPFIYAAGFSLPLKAPCFFPLPTSFHIEKCRLDIKQKTKDDGIGALNLDNVATVLIWISQNHPMEI